MRPLSDMDILNTWERGQIQHQLDKALTLLGAAFPDTTREKLAALSIGQRDAYLLKLRELTFGPMLNGFAECPICRERLEFSLKTGDIRLAHKHNEKKQELTVENFILRFRMPDSFDLAVVAGCKDEETAYDALVHRCVIEAFQGSNPIDTSELPLEVLAELARRMADCEPQAEVLLELHCPSCNHSWQVILDIVSFFWIELNAYAQLLLRDIHTLAQAYGWREADILSISAARRHFYIEMVI